MKMVKSLLLGSAAGLVAVVGAQAADLPVKAKPVQYVKICTLYGDGFYYIPGTDTCIKFSGYIRADYGWGSASQGTSVINSGAPGAQDRLTTQFSTRHRARFEVDARMQTAYGTLRNYESMNFEQSTPGGTAGDSFGLSRAFIQWAGFTFGHAQSLSDTWDLDDSWRYISQENSGSTGANGVNQIAYTWEVGNGMALTVGADEAARKPISNLSNTGALAVGTGLVDSAAGQRWPDPYIAFNVNQAWGRFAAAVRAHDVSATYYDTTGTINNFACPPAQANTTQCGHPDDKVGWAASVGAEFKMDFITPGDKLGMSLHGGVGHSRYVNSRMNALGLFDTGNQVAFGWASDGVFVNGSQIELTSVWTVQVGYEHYWTPSLKSDFTGAYSEISYNDTATAWFQKQLGNVCAPAGSVAAATAAAKSTNVSAGTVAGSNSCDPNFQYFQGGIRTQWNVTKAFFLGVDVAYNHTFTAFQGAGSLQKAQSFRPTGIYTFDDFGAWTVAFRALSAF